MNFFPLCTAIVCPTISGITVERRDHVLMTFFSLARFIASTFSSSEVSTNGPFFSDRLIIPAGPKGPALHSLFRSSLNDEPVRVLAPARLVALRRLAPRRHRMPAARCLPLTAAERVIDRVHRHAAHVWTLAKPAAAPCLADRDVLVVKVADLPDRRHALDIDLANLPGRHTHGGVIAFASDQLHRRTRAPRNLAAPARPQFHVVDGGAGRDVLQRQTVARKD